MNTQQSFNVYRVQATALFWLSSFHGFLFMKSFGTRMEAEKWIRESGKRKAEYTILDIIKTY
jgi:hypothetical protein